MSCDRSTDYEILIHHANRRTLGHLHPTYSDFVRRGARSRCYPHWLGLGDSRGRGEAGGRKNQERQVYQEARRKRKMSRIISATLTRNNGVYSIPRVRMGALTPWLRLYLNRPFMSSRCKKILQTIRKAFNINGSGLSGRCYDAPTRFR